MWVEHVAHQLCDINGDAEWSVPLSWNSPKTLCLLDTMLNEGEQRDSVQFHLLSPLWSLERETHSWLRGLWGVQWMGKLYLGRSSQNKRRRHDWIKTERLDGPLSVQTLFIPFYGFGFFFFFFFLVWFGFHFVLYLSPSCPQGSLQWYRVMSL